MFPIQTSNDPISLGCYHIPFQSMNYQFVIGLIRFYYYGLFFESFRHNYLQTMKG